MVIGKKFWPIDATGSYLPSAQPGTFFTGEVDNTVTVAGLDAATVAAIAAALATSTAGIGISGQAIAPGTVITATGVNDITLNKPALGMAAIVKQAKLQWWDLDFPSVAGGDAPIQAVLCLDSTHGAFEFEDLNGKTVTIPASTLVKGAVYYFQIGVVSTVTAGDFVGYSAS